MHMYKTPMKEAGGGRQKDHTRTQARGGVGGGQHFVTQSWEHGDEAKGGAEGKHGVGPQSQETRGKGQKQTLAGVQFTSLSTTEQADKN